PLGSYGPVFTRAGNIRLHESIAAQGLLRTQTSHLLLGRDSRLLHLPHLHPGLCAQKDCPEIWRLAHPLVCAAGKLRAVLAGLNTSVAWAKALKKSGCMPWARP